MSSFLGSTLDGSNSNIICLYVNATSQLQFIQITNIPNYYWDKVVLPGQKLIFPAVKSASLEIYIRGNDTAIMKDCIPCYQLHIDESTTLTKRLSLTNSI